MISYKTVVKMTGVAVASTMLLFQGCGKKQNKDLVIEFTGDGNYVIEATATSCSNMFDYYWAVIDYNNPPSGSTQAPVPPTMTSGGVAGPYLSLGQMALIWNAEKPNTRLVVVYVRFEINSPMITGGTMTYTLSDRDLFTTWRWSSRIAGNPVLPTDYSNRATTDAAGTNTHLSDCEVRIPGIGIANRKMSGSGSIKVMVYAVEKNAEGKETPVIGNGLVNFKFLGTQ